VRLRSPSFLLSAKEGRFIGGIAPEDGDALGSAPTEELTKEEALEEEELEDDELDENEEGGWDGPWMPPTPDPKLCPTKDAPRKSATKLRLKTFTISPTIND